MADSDPPWLPSRALLRDDGLYLSVKRIAADQLRDPFLQQTIDRVGTPESVMHLPREALGRLAPAAAPAGIVLHVGRCGSTLVSQLLRQVPGVVVYAEPQAINEILLPTSTWPRTDVVAALRSLAPVFAQHARGPYVLKLSSWNTLFAAIVQEAFPDTPWVLCLRDPLEVGVSLLRDPPGWMRGDDGPARQLALAIDPEGKCGSREEFVARFFAACCQATARLDAARGLHVGYETLPQAVWRQIATHFALRVDGATQARMAEVALQHAKAPPDRPAGFVPDSDAKRAAASDALRHWTDTVARPALALLTPPGRQAEHR